MTKNKVVAHVTEVMIDRYQNNHTVDCPIKRALQSVGLDHVTITISRAYFYDGVNHICLELPEDMQEKIHLIDTGAPVDPFDVVFNYGE